MLYAMTWMWTSHISPESLISLNMSRNFASERCPETTNCLFAMETFTDGVWGPFLWLLFVLYGYPKMTSRPQGRGSRILRWHYISSITQKRENRDRARIFKICVRHLLTTRFQIHCVTVSSLEIKFMVHKDPQISKMFLSKNFSFSLITWSQLWCSWRRRGKRT